MAAAEHTAGALTTPAPQQRRDAWRQHVPACRRVHPTLPVPRLSPAPPVAPPQVIKEKLGINCLYSSGVMELTRGIRAQLTGLVAGLSAQDLRPMSLGLSHSLSRYKLKFSPDKVDTMIVQVSASAQGSGAAAEVAAAAGAAAAAEAVAAAAAA